VVAAIIERERRVVAMMGRGVGMEESSVEVAVIGVEVHAVQVQ
jgi:hypothetical protein